jgi:hypothetical protein
MPDPTRTPPIPPEPAATAPPRSGDVERPTAKQRPARDVKDGAFDDSVAGEEDPGAGIDTMTPRPHR